MLLANLRSRLQLGLFAVLLIYAVVVVWRYVGNRVDRSELGSNILLNATINHTPVTLIFDTGAGDTFVFAHIARRLGLTVSRQEPIGELSPGFVLTNETQTVDLFVLGQTFRTTLSVLDDVEGADLEYDGILGWKSLEGRLLTFDGLTRRLELVQAIPESALHWQWFKTSRANILQIQSVEAGEVLTIFVDTGIDAGVCLPPQQWRDWRAAHPDAPTTIEPFYFLAGSVLETREVCWAEEIKLGPLILTHVPVQEATEADLNLGGSGYIGTLGLYGVSQTRLAIDGKALLAYVETLKTPGRPFLHNRLGAVFVPDRSDHTSFIAHVAPGSPAFQAGIRDGDRLLKVNNLDTIKQTSNADTLGQANFWQQPAGTKLMLTLSRDGKEFKAYPVLRDLIGPGIK